MPRVYVSRSSRPYKRYDPLILKTAIEAYNVGNKSILQIAKQYNIAKSVLHRHVTRHVKKQGGQRCLSEEVEKYIIKYINICSEWGYPMDTLDLRLIIKGYLDRLGLDIKKFRNNLPGRDFVEGFLKRYNKEISQRISENIKRSRAAVSPQVIQDYFKELQVSLEGVPLCNIVNYDESNLADDPGKKKVLTKRGVKYPERVMNHTKSSTSIMMAATADGTLLPCYVVYKSTHLYNTWTSNGPTNCRYNRTTSGWFDGNSFEDWVDTVALPYFSEKSGKKILIGDNLSSHLSINIIRKCQEHNVHFVFLPPNSTHLTQPLDVAFFRPMKIAWRDILYTWKKTEGRMLPSIPKSVFPSLLRKMFQKMEPNIKRNILAGFTKTGISPIDKEKVLSRLPGNHIRNELSTEEKEAIDESVLSLLKEMRYGSQSTNATKKLKKINVKPGKSVDDSDYLDSDISSSNGLSESGLKTQINTKRKPKGPKMHISNEITAATEEKENVISQEPFPNLNAEKENVKGKGIGKKSKTKKCNPGVSNVIIGEHTNIFKEQDENKFELMDIASMPIVLDDNFLVTEEIQIVNEQEEQEKFDEMYSYYNDNINLFSDGTRMDDMVNEARTFKDTEQTDKVHPCTEKLQCENRIPDGKKINIISDKRVVIYKKNTNKPNDPKAITVPPRRPSYYRNESDILRDLLDADL